MKENQRKGRMRLMLPIGLSIAYIAVEYFLFPLIAPRAIATGEWTHIAVISFIFGSIIGFAVRSLRANQAN